MEVDYSEVNTCTKLQDGSKEKDSSRCMWKTIKERFKFDNACHRRNFIQTFCVYLNFIMLGWNYGQLGTAFHDLQLVLDTNVKQTSLIFTMNSIGYMVGSMSIGFVYDRMDKLLLLGVVSIANALASAVTPWCTSYGTFLAIRLLTGFLCGGLDSGGNAKVASCWGTGGAQYMQALHFSYAFGGIISPLITSLFMARRIDTPYSGNTTEVMNQTATGWNREELLLEFNITNIDTTNSLTEMGVNQDAPVANPTEVLYGETHIHIAFIITGVLTAMTGSCYLILYRLGYETVGAYYTRAISGHGGKKSNESRKSRRYPNLSTAQMAFFICILALSVILFSAVECKFQSFLMPFILMQMQWTKRQGAYVISLLWAFYAFGRFLGIPISRCLTPCKLLIISMSFTLLFCIAMFVGAYWHIHALIWITVPFSGLSISVIFPSYIVWTGDHVTQITGKMAGYFLCVAALGYLLDPLYIGVLMENLSPLYFVYLQIGEISFSLLIFILLVFWVRRQK